jgi:cytochrome c oxidase subunit 2
MFEGWPPPVLDPAGPYASSVTLLSWILFAMAAAVLLVVLAALYVALFGRPELQQKVGGKTAIWAGGVAFPLVVLTALLIYGLSLTRHLSDPIQGDELRVRITGEMWWWRVAYLGADGREVVQDANELHIPAGGARVAVGRRHP